MDRFPMHVFISHPDRQPSLKSCVWCVVKAVNGAVTHQPTMPQEVVFEARKRSPKSVSQSPWNAISSISSLPHGQRRRQSVRKYIQVGVSPRGSIALDKCARGQAWLNGREQVSVEDIRAVANDCLRHRLMLSFEAQADGVTSDEVINTLLQNVAIAQALNTAQRDPLSTEQVEPAQTPTKQHQGSRELHRFEFLRVYVLKRRPSRSAAAGHEHFERALWLQTAWPRHGLRRAAPLPTG